VDHVNSKVDWDCELDDDHCSCFDHAKPSETKELSRDDHSHYHYSRVDTSVVKLSIDDCDCCHSGDDHSHNQNLVDHGHDRGHKLEREEDSDDDNCSCCHHSEDDHSQNQVDHGHDHGHNEESCSAHNAKKDEDSDDNCSCCHHSEENAPYQHDHSHQMGHDHAHGADHGHSFVLDDDDDDCSCCSHAAKKTIDHGYDNCCDIDDDDCACCGHQEDTPCAEEHSPANHDHSHGHDHAHGAHNHASSTNEKALDYSNYHQDHSIDVYDLQLTMASASITDIAKIAIGEKPDSVEITVQARICNFCDGKSDIPHAYQVTRLRVANLCCAGEESLIRSCIEGLHGVRAVSVNVVGRYAIVKHCPVDCCAPTSKLLGLLNDQRLGASVQEANDSPDDDNAEAYVDVLYLAYWLLLLSLFIAGVISMRLAHGTDEHSTRSNIPALALYVIGTAIGIVPVVHGAFIAVVRKTIDIHILMLIAIIGALIAGEFFDACLLVTLFVGAGLIEDTVMRIVRQAVKISTQNMAKMAVIASTGQTVKVEDLKVGDVIAVRTGDMICCDGEVVKGDGVVNESALTGESLPVPKKFGVKVYGGTIVQNGYLEVKITVAVKESAMNVLKQTVDDMQADRGEYAKLVDSFAYYWTPVVLLAAFILVIAGGEVSNDYPTYVHKGLVLLVLACPCAIVIAAPIPSVCTIAMAARYGVLIKGSSVIERLAVVDTLAVDKTGTLTKGFCKVLGKLSLTANGSSNYNAMELAAAIESKSTHPLANAVVSDHCGCIAEMDSNLPEAKKIKVLDGIGITGMVQVKEEWVPTHVGNERLLKLENPSMEVLSASQQQMIDDFCQHHRGCSIIYVAVNHRIELIIAIADEVRDESRSFVQQVQNQGLSVTMLTGDHQTVALEVARALGIDLDQGCKYRLLPQDKLQWVQNQQDEMKKKVMMIGDGINDATALTMASVGAAMGEGGSAMTVSAADLVIMSDNLLRIPSTIELCRITKAIIIENCVFAVLVKIAASVLAIIGLLSLWNAVLVDLVTLLIVIMNGTRPFLFKYFYSRSNLDQILKSKGLDDNNQGIELV
jgi:Zn2+/Cd2+-exporting ATPase